VGNNERSEIEFEEKAEYINRVQGAHSRSLFERILSNPKTAILPYDLSYGDLIVPYGDDVSFGPIKREEAEFEEKTEYSNRVQGVHSGTLFKRILSNSTSSLLPYGL
jgi:hypothetical protein